MHTPGKSTNFYSLGDIKSCGCIIHLSNQWVKKWGPVEVIEQYSHPEGKGVAVLLKIPTGTLGLASVYLPPRTTKAMERDWKEVNLGVQKVIHSADRSIIAGDFNGMFDKVSEALEDSDYTSAHTDMYPRCKHPTRSEPGKGQPRQIDALFFSRDIVEDHVQVGEEATKNTPCFSLMESFCVPDLSDHYALINRFAWKAGDWSRKPSEKEHKAGAPSFVALPEYKEERDKFCSNYKSPTGMSDVGILDHFRKTLVKWANKVVSDQTKQDKVLLEKQRKRIEAIIETEEHQRMGTPAPQYPDSIREAVEDWNEHVEGLRDKKASSFAKWIKEHWCKISSSSMWKRLKKKDPVSPIENMHWTHPKTGEVHSAKSVEEVPGILSQKLQFVFQKPHHNKKKRRRR